MGVGKPHRPERGSPKGVVQMATVTSVNEAREAGLAILASDARMAGVHFNLPFGEVVVDRAGVVRLAEDVA